MPEVEIDAPMALPEGVREVADRSDAARSDLIESVTPEGDFSVDGINDVIDELNAVLPKFGMEPLEAVSTSEGTLPTEVTQALMMVAQAAQDARIMDLIEDLDALADDQDLLVLAGKLRSLAGSTDFDRFLATEAPRIQEPAAPEEAPDESAPTAQPPSGGGLPSDDELFAARI